jgi:DUF1365 family protein
MITRSAIYTGDVVHARTRPRRHRLHYRVFALLIDLDELEALDRRLRLFSRNRWAPISFREGDHGEGIPGGLRAWVETRLQDAGLDVRRPRIEVLAYPRLWGYVFNPLTVYFCRDGQEALRAILYEVSNTFGEKMTYVIPVDGASELVHQRTEKLHYVSPFVPMEATYEFFIKPPTNRISIRIDEYDRDGFLLRAVFAGKRRSLNDRNLLWLLLRYPLMTLKVTAAIHFEAMRLWLKGLPVFRHVPAGRRIDAVTVPPPVFGSTADHGPRHRETETMGQ